MRHNERKVTFFVGLRTLSMNELAKETGDIVGKALSSTIGLEMLMVKTWRMTT